MSENQNQSPPPTIAIIGGGVSGCLVATHLLRNARSRLEILLIERSQVLGRGVAYSTDSDAHLLNVPASRMSAFEDDPGHFQRWLEERAGRLGFPAHVGPSDFVPRRLYGRYVSQVLDEARTKAAKGVVLTVIRADATDLEELPGGGGRVHLHDGRRLAADKVVFAIGNLPGEYPIRKALPIYETPRYVHIPWQSDWTERVGLYDTVLLVGAGLTATDMILRLSYLGHQGPIVALSRHGHRPLVHRTGPEWRRFLGDGVLPTTVLGAIRLFRSEVRAAAADGVDWRAVVDAARPDLQRLWRGFPWAERARFLRHARATWEVHRHRVAPAVGNELDRLVHRGQLRYIGGRLAALEQIPAGVRARIRRRRTGDIVEQEAAIVVNCTGPRADYSKFKDPLLVNALGRGLIDHDPLALGIHATPEGRVHRYRGDPSPWLFTLGTPMKGILWESTAVREIRQQSVALARTLLGSDVTPW